MKTIGIKRADGLKNYRILHDGHEWIARRHGSYFECNGSRGSVKDIKAAILDGSIPRDLSLTEEVALSIEDDHKDEHKHEPLGVWDCVDPCALLILLGGSLDEAMIKASIAKTLDAHGYLLADGTPDRGQAMREWLRHHPALPEKSAQQHLIDNDERCNRERIGNALDRPGFGFAARAVDQAMDRSVVRVVKGVDDEPTIGDRVEELLGWCGVKGVDHE